MRKHVALAVVSLLLCACALNSDILDPPCDQPAPLEGQSDPGVSGFIIGVRESTSYPGILAHELGRKYGFIPDAIFRAGGFSVVEITPRALANLRCDPDVENVSFIRRTWTTGHEKP
jgi:hypothetical protein